MKAGLIVLCRFSSSRLPGKVLMPVQGKPLLDYILERLDNSKSADEVIVATSDEESDDPINDHCIRRSIPCYRGSLENVAKRFLACSTKHGLDYAVRINGDNIFADPNMADQLIDLAVEKRANFVSNVPGRSFPIGMSVEVLRTSFYERRISNFTSKEHFEHVTLQLYQAPDTSGFHFITNQELPEAAGLKLAIDCKEDLDFVNLLLQKMEYPHTHYGWKDIVRLAHENKSLDR